MKKTFFLIIALIMSSLFQPIYTMEQEEYRKPEIYQLLDSLTIPATNVNWSAVFAILDEMQGAIDINEYTTTMGETLLVAAVSENNFLAAKTLLDKYHANPDKSGSEPTNITPLRMALAVRATTGDDIMVKLLRYYGAKIN